MVSLAHAYPKGISWPSQPILRSDSPIHPDGKNQGPFVQHHHDNLMIAANQRRSHLKEKESATHGSVSLLMAMNNVTSSDSKHSIDDIQGPVGRLFVDAAYTVAGINLHAISWA